jgi:DnaJ like chaperone protein
VGIWGKILGGVAGFAVGGPLGALVGAALGHAADSGVIGPTASRLPRDAAGLAAFLGNRETLFAIGVIVLSAKLAKCDGPVKREEIDAFKRLFHIPPENIREVGRLFDEARATHEGFEPFADRLGEAFADNRALLEEVLAALFAIARADGPINRTEEAYLGAVHLRFGLDRAAWDRARGAAPSGVEAAADHVSWLFKNNTATRAAPSGVEAAADPYAVLGLSRSATDEELRAAWRRLIRENHPDSLIARGVPEEFVRRAHAKVAEINAAWDRIKRERGL